MTSAMPADPMEAAFPFFSRSDFQDQPSSRAYRPHKMFEAVLDRVLGERVRADGACGVDLWCALANIRWRGPDGEIVSYGFRRAGNVVAWVREEGDYLTWYCSGEPGQVAGWIEDALAEAGWSWVLPNTDVMDSDDVTEDDPLIDSDAGARDERWRRARIGNVGA